MAKITLELKNGRKSRQKKFRIPAGLHISNNISARPATREPSFIPCLRVPDFTRCSAGSVSQKIANIMMPLGIVVNSFC
jgi:hypothetical protein